MKIPLKVIIYSDHPIPGSLQCSDHNQLAFLTESTIYIITLYCEKSKRSSSYNIDTIYYPYKERETGFKCIHWSPSLYPYQESCCLSVVTTSNNLLHYIDISKSSTKQHDHILHSEWKLQGIPFHDVSCVTWSTQTTIIIASSKEPKIDIYSLNLSTLEFHRINTIDISFKCTFIKTCITSDTNHDSMKCILSCFNTNSILVLELSSWNISYSKLLQLENHHLDFIPCHNMDLIIYPDNSVYISYSKSHSFAIFAIKLNDSSYYECINSSIPDHTPIVSANFDFSSLLIYTLNGYEYRYEYNKDKLSQTSSINNSCFGACKMNNESIAILSGSLISNNSDTFNRNLYCLTIDHPKVIDISLSHSQTFSRPSSEYLLDRLTLLIQNNIDITKPSKTISPDIKIAMFYRTLIHWGDIFDDENEELRLLISKSKQYLERYILENLALKLSKNEHSLLQSIFIALYSSESLKLATNDYCQLANKFPQYSSLSFSNSIHIFSTDPQILKNNLLSLDCDSDSKTSIFSNEPSLDRTCILCQSSIPFRSLFKIECNVCKCIWPRSIWTFEPIFESKVLVCDICDRVYDHSNICIFCNSVLSRAFFNKLY